MIRRLYLFDDAEARAWAPFALTRPIGELMHGALLLRERIERATGLGVSGYRGPPELEGFEEPGSPPVLGPGEPPQGEVRILLNSRYLPPLSEGGGTAPSLRFPFDLPEEGLRLIHGDATVGWILPPGALLPEADHPARSDDPDAPGPDARFEIPGSMVHTPWTLMSGNAERIGADLRLLFPGGRGPGAQPLPAREGVIRIGEHPVSVEEGVVVEPGAVLDSSEGPIHLAAGSRVRALTRLEGPAFVGAGTHLLGGVIRHLSCGPVCKLHGEIDTVVVLGYSNKPHEGYLGHAVLGRWVNLGAMTTSSDLKNTYGSVRLPDPEGGAEIDTGLQKVGAFIGDHAKTGIGTLLNTGTRIGAGSNLFGDEMPPRFVPPFSWGSGERLTVHRKDAFLRTAERVMRRRDLHLTPGMHNALSRAWERSRGGTEEPEVPGPQEERS